MLIIGLIATLVICVWQITAQQTGPQAGAQTRVIFLCGQTSQQVMSQMVPMIPKITKDTYGFIYLSYNFDGVIFIFQFYNDKLAGILIGAPAVPLEQENKAPQEKRYRGK